MGILDRLNLFIEIYIRIIRSLKSVRLLAPFIILAFLESIWLLALVYFYYPPINRLLTPLLKYFYSDLALHYPRFYFILPQIYKYGSTLALDFVFGIILTAAAIFMLGTDFKQERGGLIEGIRTAVKSLPALILIWLLKTVLVILVFKYGGSVILPLVSDFPFSFFASIFAIQILGLIVSMLLVYAFPAIVLQHQGFLQAIGSSLRLSSKNFVFTFMLLFIPWFILFPIGYLTTAKLIIILYKFSSTMLVYLLFLEIIISIAANYLLYAGVTYFFLNETE